MPFCSLKNALLYSLTKCSYSKCPLQKGILNKCILSRDIGGHFLKGKRAFPPNRQKPCVLCGVTPAFLCTISWCHHIIFQIYLRLLAKYCLDAPNSAAGLGSSWHWPGFHRSPPTSSPTLVQWSAPLYSHSLSHQCSGHRHSSCSNSRE